MKRPLLSVDPATQARLQQHYEAAKARANRTAGFALFVAAAYFLWLSMVGH